MSTETINIATLMAGLMDAEVACDDGLQPKFPLLRSVCPPGHQHRMLDCPGYVWNTAANAITEAIRAVGWTVNIYSEPTWLGDFITIYSSKGLKVIGRVEADEGLRGQDALIVAVARAQQIGGAHESS